MVSDVCKTMDPAKTVSIHPYFRVSSENMQAFQDSLATFIERTSTEPGCLYYDFTINGDVVHCREAYVGAEGALAHLDNVGDLLEKALGISELIRLEIHGAAEELDQMREPLGDLNPDWFVFHSGVAKG